MVLPSDSQQLELEAHYRLEAARRITDAILGGQWLPDPAVVRMVAVLAEQAARFLEVAGWPCDWVGDEAAA